MKKHFRGLSRLKLIPIFVFLILFSLLLKPAFSDNIISVHTVQGPAFPIYYKLISGMGPNELWFTPSASNSTAIASTPLIFFGNLKGCEFDLDGNLIVTNKSSLSFDVFAASVYNGGLTLKCVSELPSGANFVAPEKGAKKLAVGHFSWENSPQQDETNLVVFEASLGSTKLGKNNQRILKIVSYSEPQLLLSSSKARVKSTKLNALKTLNHDKTSKKQQASQYDQLPSLFYYDLSVNAYGGVYVLGDMDMSDLSMIPYAVDVQFSDVSGGNVDPYSLNLIAVYKGKTLSFTVSAYNDSENPSQILNLKNLYIPDGAVFTDPPPSKDGYVDAGFQWPVDPNTTDGIYTAIFVSYLSVRANSTSPVFLIIHVKVSVEPDPAIGIIGSDQNNLNNLTFNTKVTGPSPAPQTFSVSNTGGKSLNWAATKNAGWLTLSKSSGGPLTVGNSDSVTVTINSTGLAPNTYTDTITISDPAASNNPQTVSVTLNVAGPAIELAPSPVSFDVTVGTTPESRSLTISNTGNDVLNWTASKTKGWLNLSKSSGTIQAGNSDSIAASVNISGLQPGPFSDTITVTDPNASNSPQTVPVNLTLVAAPKIGLTATSLTFSATQGGANPGSKSFQVKNDGGRTLNWTATKTKSWLTLSSASGALTAGQSSPQITVSVNISGLSPGANTDTITIAAPGASNTPQTIQVTLNLSGAIISVDTPSLSFNATSGGENPGSTPSVWNSGTGTLSWTASKNQNWLTLSPASGTSTGPANTNPLGISVNVANLAAGTYTGTITISGSGAAPKTISVTVNVAAAPPATIGKDTTALSFSANVGSTPGSKTLSIWNAGTGTLNWTAQKSAGATWFSITPASGSSTGSSNRNTMTVSITPGLGIGTYTGTITINATGAVNTPQTISVTLTVSQPIGIPRIGVETVNIGFAGNVGGQNPSSQTLSVWNSGTGTLSWSAAKTQTWLNISPASGSSTGSGNPNPMTISVNTSGLTQAMDYTDTITISSSGASNSPLRITVTLTLSASLNTPTIGGLPSSLSFSTPAGSTGQLTQNMSVTNTGGGSLNWTASKGQTWLSVTPSGGPLLTNQSSQITVSLQGYPTAIGTYTDTITVSASGATNSPRQVSVILNILPANPLIGFNPPGNQPVSLAFSATVGGVNPGSQTFSVYNAGTGTLNWTATKAQSWLTILPGSGSSAYPGGSPATTITVSVNIAGLAAGTYGDTITISGSGSVPAIPPADNQRTVPVTLTISPPAPAQVGVAPNPPSAISLRAYPGLGPEPATLYIWNKGTGSMSWSASPGASWLSVTPSSGTTNAESTESGLPRRDKVRVSANVQGLPAGVHNTTINVNALGGITQVPVVLTIIGSGSAGELLVYNPPVLFSTNSTVLGSMSQAVKIGNVGQGSMTWTASSDQTWLSISPISGVLSSGTSTSVRVTASTADKPVGTYDAYIKVETTGGGAGGSPSYLHVILKVHQPGWDYPALPEFASGPQVTPLDGLFRSDASYYGILYDSVAPGTKKYYSIDTTAFVKNKLSLATNFVGAESGNNGDLYIIRKGWPDGLVWHGSSTNGTGRIDHQITEYPGSDCENERYYVKLDCLGPTTMCSFMIWWEPQD